MPTIHSPLSKIRIYLVPLTVAFFWAAALVLSASAVSGQEISICPAQPKQGQTLEVKVSLSGQAEMDASANRSCPPEVSFNNRAYRTFPVALPAADKSREPDDSAPVPPLPAKSVYRALLGIPCDLKPGTYILQAGSCRKPVQVVAGGFGVQRLHLPSDKDNFLASPGEEEAVNQAKETVTDEQFWRGKFHLPCKARITTQFGLRRVVNGRLLADYFHSGLDFAGASGTAVAAAQDGRVLMAHTGWRLHGNTICIDHGQGVISFYIHLKNILVKPGQLVKAGDLIGHVGQTGRANGPHLHFSIYVNKDATNPFDWFNKAF